ncbi:hypothetical protein LCGC14_1844620 [marine sediment metagenome]|uniref:Uncharacterized protein n=1 Tax=marine sediment metagenome TaxID=412755 RepID=A0A0F9GCF5_9ZZZZ
MTELAPDTVAAVEDTVTIDNVEYKISDLTENEQRLIEVYKTWKDEELVAQREVMKLQAAQREIAREIVLDVRRTLEATAAAAEEAATKAREAVEKANGKDEAPVKELKLVNPGKDEEQAPVKELKLVNPTGDNPSDVTDETETADAAPDSTEA